MAGQLASFFATLGFKADYRELDKYERRLKNLNKKGGGVGPSVKQTKHKYAALTRIHKKYNNLKKDLSKKAVTKDLADLKKLLNANRISTKEYQDMRDRITHDFVEAEKKKRAAAKRTSDAAQREIDKRGKKEAQAHAEDIRRTKRAAAVAQQEAKKRARVEAQAYAENARRIRQRRDKNKQAAEDHMAQERRLAEYQNRAFDRRMRQMQQEAAKRKKEARQEAAEIQRMGFIRARARAEDRRRAEKAHREEMARIRAENRAAKRMLSRGAGAVAGGALAMGFAGQQSVTSYQKSLGMERGLTAGTGDKEKGKEEMEWLVNLSKKLGVNVADVGTGYSQIVASAQGTSLAGQDSRDIFEAVLSQARVLNLSAADTIGSTRAISQIFSKNQVMAEEARQQLGDRMPGAMQMLGKAAQDAGLSVNGTVAELSDLMKKGEVTAEDIMPFFAKRMQEAAERGGALEESMNSTAASIGRFQTAVWDANRVFNQSGFDKAVGDLFDRMTTAVSRSDPTWTILGKSMAVLGDSLETVVEAFGYMGEHLSGALLDKAGNFTEEAQMMAGALLVLSSRLRTVFALFILLPAAISAIVDTFENGFSSWDDFTLKMFTVGGALLFLLGPIGKVVKAMGKLMGLSKAVAKASGATSGAAGAAGAAAASGKFGKVATATKGVAGALTGVYFANQIANPIKDWLGISGEYEGGYQDEIDAYRKIIGGEPVKMTPEELKEQRKANTNNILPMSNSFAMPRVGDPTGNSKSIINGDVVFNIDGTDPDRIAEEAIKASNMLFGTKISQASLNNPDVEKGG